MEGHTHPLSLVFIGSKSLQAMAPHSCHNRRVVVFSAVRDPLRVLDLSRGTLRTSSDRMAQIMILCAGPVDADPSWNQVN